MRFDEAKFMPGGDHFILVQFGDDGSIDLNFLALGLTAVLKREATPGVVDANPSYNSLVVEYESDDISYADLQAELERLSGGLGSVEELELDSRLAYLPVMLALRWALKLP